MNAENIKATEFEEFSNENKIEWDMSFSDSKIKPNLIFMYKLIRVSENIVTLIRVLNKKMLLEKFDIFLVVDSCLDVEEIRKIVTSITNFDFSETNNNKAFPGMDILDQKSYIQKSDYKGLDLISDIRTESEILIAMKLLKTLKNDTSEG